MVTTMYDLSDCSHCREAYGDVLAELGESNPRIVVLDSDLSGSTKTASFAKKFPDRFFDVGIAEQNLMDVAAGLSLCGKIPFVSTFAIFGTGRGWEQIRNTIAFDNLHVNLVFTHAGLSLGGDGATHQSLEDIALMRVIPGMQVIVPADCVETRSVIRYAADTPGPKYIRISRRRTLNVFSEKEYSFDLMNYPVLEEGTDVALFANGCMIREALKACYALRRESISAKVINAHTVKPLPKDVIVDAARQTGAIVTVEEHSIIGGLGSAIAEVVSEEYPVPVKRVGSKDRFAGSGSTDDLYMKLGINSDAIVHAVRTLVRQRG